MILGIAIIAMITEWIADELHMSLLSGISKGINILFFIIVVVSLITQIARTKNVTVRVIMEAINGYLLLGMVFSLLVSVIMIFQPEAYSFPSREIKDVIYFSDYLYYGFVTFTTVGYGDIIPKLPYTKSLATLTGVTGQIYVAVIIAMLVGKFASSNN